MDFYSLHKKVTEEEVIELLKQLNKKIDDMNNYLKEDIAVRKEIVAEMKRRRKSWVIDDLSEMWF